MTKTQDVLFVNRLVRHLDATRIADPYCPYYILKISNVTVYLQISISEPKQVLILIPLYPEDKNLNLNFPKLPVECDYQVFPLALWPYQITQVTLVSQIDMDNEAEVGKCLVKMVYTTKDIHDSISVDIR